MSGETRILHPHWWNSHQGRVWQGQIQYSLKQPEIWLNNHRSAKIAIAHLDTDSTNVEDKRLEWLLKWSVVHCFHGDGSLNDKAEGQFRMTEEEVLAAFCFHDLAKELNEATTARRFEGNLVRLGKFIRQNKYLNIPGPGTGLEGDPNISVLVSPDIADQVGKFVKANRRPHIRLVVVNRKESSHG